MKRFISLSVVVLLVGVGCEGTGQQAANDSKAGDPVADNQAAKPDAPSDPTGWVTERWDRAVSEGNQTVAQTTRWVTDLYQAAKDEGLTRANSVKEWVTDDWQSKGDWQYKVVTLDPSDAAAVEQKLNELGQDRWDCFHVEATDDQWTFLMKRPKRSYLKNLPLRDLANILPMISSDGEQSPGN